ncbi:MAG: Na/Pi cotransporter family protein, partial [Oscillospiraceae bacterium]|nr:Na/Pi cotransporter family protein [Oscillospiraceae bacterium]
MQISDFIGLLGGLALFLYGMNMMSTGLEAAAGDKMKSILEKLTSNRILGVVVGAVVTAIIQSSSATTVMVVGFVNSGLMTLNQAVWVIMGANIGTTITGQLVALDVGAIAPLVCFAGVAIITFMKNPKLHHWASIAAGLGMLFIGMDMMSASMAPLRDSELFVNIVSTFSNPLVGIIVGAVFTALIQSSSASVGILQALAMSGVVHMDTAIFVLFGQNIGTCITSVLASIGTSRAAKRTTYIHLMFNLIGTALFTIIAIVFPLVPFIEKLSPGDVTKQIANTHTIFNICTTLLLLPLGNYMAKLTYKILPIVPEETPTEMHLQYLDDAALMNSGSTGSSMLHISMLKQEVLRMLSMAKEAVVMGYDAVMNNDSSKLAEAEKLEEYLDYLNKEI